MKNMGLRNALWRSRAVAIIGFLIILLVIFDGLPGSLKSTLFIVFGLLTLAFGFAGSRHKSYSETEIEAVNKADDSLTTEQIYPVVEENQLGDQLPEISEDK